ncbi:nucleotide exchange factor GrpE [Candidatus Woesearchaeota archaeon]|nr:nucleotide exchange factor GrpE [Candidatus Woesearchaeota archaeon]
MAKETGEKSVDDKKEAKIKELTETAKRVQADFENYKKRMEKEKQDFIKEANADLLKRLLNIIDNFELALKSEQNHEDFVKGVELIYAQLKELMTAEGVKEIETEGKQFDPYVHEAMITGNDDTKKDGEILEELQKGYTLKDTVLRHSKVKVNKP